MKDMYSCRCTILAKVVGTLEAFYTLIVQLPPVSPSSNVDNTFKDSASASVCS